MVFGAPDRTASGDRVTLRFKTDCADQAAVILRHRADLIGLGDPVLQIEPDAVLFELTLPGLPDDHSAIPALLARPGKLVLSVAGQTVATEEDLGGKTALNLDSANKPYAQIPLTDAAAKRYDDAVAGGAGMELRLDDELLMRQDPAPRLEDGVLRPSPPPASASEEMRTAADWTIVIGGGAMPCPVAYDGLAG